MDQPKKPIILLPMGLILLMLISLSCSYLRPVENAQPDLTLTSMSGAIVGTATAEAAKGDPAMNNLRTAEARATSTVLAIQATQAARSSNVSYNQYATSTVSAPILAELPFYGIHDGLGNVGWMTDTLTLSVDGYKETKFLVAPVTASDFVLSSEITWNTQYGSSGCGFVFRSNGDTNQPDAYMFTITRFATGHAIFTALLDGKLANIHDFFPKDNNVPFNTQNGAMNRIAVAAQGNTLRFYANTELIAEIDTTQPPGEIPIPPAPVRPDGSDDETLEAYKDQLEEYQSTIQELQAQYAGAMALYEEAPAIFTNGFVGLGALSESGLTECTFTDTWLWILTP